MELKININYNQILRLIHQLPKRDINRLVMALNSDLKLEKTTQTIQELITNAPNWTDTDYNNYSKGRNHLNNSRLA